MNAEKTIKNAHFYFFPFIPLKHVIILPNFFGQLKRTFLFSKKQQNKQNKMFKDNYEWQTQ